MMDNKKKELNKIFKNNLPNWYFKKGLILIDIFILVALVQYFIFNGSFNDMIHWIIELF